MILVHEETAADREAIRQINRLAFEADDEAVLVDRLREEGYMVLSLVAEVQGRVVGHILFSRMQIETAGGAVPAVALAPMAVHPEWQRNGIGSALARRGLELCRERGHRIMIVVGHPAYYPRFGFSAELASRLAHPFPPETCMALELAASALEGVSGSLRYPPPFGL